MGPEGQCVTSNCPQCGCAQPKLSTDVRGAPVVQAQFLCDVLCFFCTCHALHQGQGHRQRRAHSCGGHNAPIGCIAHIRPVAAALGLLQQVTAVPPVACKAALVQQPGLGQYARAGTDPHQHGAMCRLGPQPCQDLRIVIAVHRRHDDIVCTLWVQTIEGSEILIDQHRMQGRHQHGRSSGWGHGHHGCCVRALQNGIGHQKVGGLCAFIGGQHRHNGRAVAPEARRIQEL